MDKTVVAELAATIASLHSSGQTGFWILLAVLIAALALGIVAIVCQWIVIARFKTVETNIKAVETNIKERQLGVKERDELRAIVMEQFSVMKESNGDLRAEVGRLREQQQGLREGVNTLLTKSLLTTDELRWLRHLAKDEPAVTDTSNKVYYEGFKKDILRLRGLQFVKNKKDKGGFSALEHAPEGNHYARDYFKITDEGRNFLALLERTLGEAATATAS